MGLIFILGSGLYSAAYDMGGMSWLITNIVAMEKHILMACGAVLIAMSVKLGMQYPPAALLFFPMGIPLTNPQTPLSCGSFDLCLGVTCRYNWYSNIRFWHLEGNSESRKALSVSATAARVTTLSAYRSVDIVVTSCSRCRRCRSYSPRV